VNRVLAVLQPKPLVLVVVVVKVDYNNEDYYVRSTSTVPGTTLLYMYQVLVQYLVILVCVKIRYGTVQVPYRTILRIPSPLRTRSIFGCHLMMVALIRLQIQDELVLFCYIRLFITIRVGVFL
jgi:hypothetical protein